MGLVFFNFPGVTSKIKNFFYSVSTPVQKRSDNFVRQIKNSWDFLNSLKNISKKNIHLEEKAKELIAQNAELKELEKENEFLRSYFNLPANQKYQIDLANVVGRDFQGLEKYILIDRGSLAGVEKNMPVIAFGNILVGRIIEVFDDFSKALLITSSNSKIPALIQESRIEGLIYGLKENFLFMDLISRDVEVKESQTVIASGIGGNFPRGLLIGKILTVESLENEIFQRITVEPAVDMDDLERVFIIKK